MKSAAIKVSKWDPAPEVFFHLLTTVQGQTKTSQHPFQRMTSRWKWRKEVDRPSDCNRYRNLQAPLVQSKEDRHVSKEPRTRFGKC